MDHNGPMDQQFRSFTRVYMPLMYPYVWYEDVRRYYELCFETTSHSGSRVASGGLVEVPQVPIKHLEELNMVDVLVVLCVYVIEFSCTLLSLFDYIYIETVGQGDQRHTDSVVYDIPDNLDIHEYCFGNNWTYLVEDFLNPIDSLAIRHEVEKKPPCTCNVWPAQHVWTANHPQSDGLLWVTGVGKSGTDRILGQ